MNWWWSLVIIGLLTILLYSVFPVIWTRTLHKSSIRITGKPGTVALTFDDGPDPDYTPKLLDALAGNNVRATFFVLSKQALVHQDIIWRMIEEGHDVQIHGSRHWFVPLLHPLATARQCLGAAREMQTTFQFQAGVYRPTWGACNFVTLLLMRRVKMRLCTWSVMVGDWRVTPATELVRRIQAKLGDQSIIVLHDSDKTVGAERGAPEAVIEAIPQLVRLVESRHLRFITMAECV